MCTMIHLYFFLKIRIFNFDFIGTLIVATFMQLAPCLRYLDPSALFLKSPSLQRSSVGASSEGEERAGGVFREGAERVTGAAGV